MPSNASPVRTDLPHFNTSTAQPFTAILDSRWEDWVCSDPIGVVRSYTDPLDQEIAGFIAASLSYGRVTSICQSVRKALDRFIPNPRDFVLNMPESASDFSGFSHRFHTPEAMCLLVLTLRRALHKYGSLKALFLKGWKETHISTEFALAAFVDELRALAPLADCCAGSEGYAFRHFLASPRDGSACKRLHLFLRWMVRTGPPDLGAWIEIPASALMTPVDVHVAAIARSQGWTRRKNPDALMSREITEVWKTVDPEDPIRFDFVLSHLGMEGMPELAGAVIPACK